MPLKVCSIYLQIRTITVDYTDNTQLFNLSFPNFINWTGSSEGPVYAPWLSRRFRDLSFLERVDGWSKYDWEYYGGYTLIFHRSVA